MPKRKIEKFILEQILKSGLPLENFVSSCFNSKEWFIFENKPYLDKDENKSREIDLNIVKQVEIGERHLISLDLIIQCKKIPGNAWVFLKGNSKIFPKLLAVTPHTNIIEDVFDESGTSLDKLEPKVTNYKEIVVDEKFSNKLTSNIFESVITLIKSTSYIREKFLEAEQMFRKELENSQMKDDFIKNPFGVFSISYPIIVFEGKMYLIDFNSKFQLKEILFVLLYVEHESINYSGRFPIYIVNKKYFKKFLKKIEEDLLLFKKRAEKKIKKIDNDILESYGFISPIPKY